MTTARNEIADPPAPASPPEPLRISRSFRARRATVFRAWSAPEHVRQWFSPEGFTAPEAEVDMRVGGAFNVLMRAPDGREHWTRGTFVEVTPDSRLVIDMHVPDEAGGLLFHALTEVDFADTSCGTRMDVVQTYHFADPARAAPMVAGAPEGWRATLDKLDALVLRMSGAVGVETRSVAHGVFHLERTYDAPRARVWRALTDPAVKRTWFARPSSELEVIERAMDVREGGRERLKGRWAGGTVSTFDAVYHDVVDETRLVYSYTMHIDEKKISVSLATIQLDGDGGRTRVRITEQGAFLDGYDDAGSREHGTGQLLEMLGASLAREGEEAARP